MKKDLETIRMWFVKIEVLINSKLAKHEEMDEREMKVNNKPKQGTEIKKQIDILTDWQIQGKRAGKTEHNDLLEIIWPFRWKIYISFIQPDYEIINTFFSKTPS